MSLVHFLAMSPAPGGGAEGGGSGPLMMNLVFIGMMVLIFYLLIWRPQAQRQKQHKEMVSSLKRGTVIVSNGGQPKHVAFSEPAITRKLFGTGCHFAISGGHQLPYFSLQVLTITNSRTECEDNERQKGTHHIAR